MSRIKYGIAHSNHLTQYTEAKPLGASETFSAKSGRFVERDGSGNYDPVDGNAEEEIVGAIDYVGSTGSSDGDVEAAIQINPYVPYEMPIYDGSSTDASLSQSDLDSLIGTSCGIKVDSNVQYADLDETTNSDQVLVIVGGDADNDTLYCIQNVGLTTETESNTII